MMLILENTTYRVTQKEKKKEILIHSKSADDSLMQFSQKC